MKRAGTKVPPGDTPSVAIDECTDPYGKPHHTEQSVDNH